MNHDPARPPYPTYRPEYDDRDAHGYLHDLEEDLHERLDRLEELLGTIMEKLGIEDE